MNRLPKHITLKHLHAFAMVAHELVTNAMKYGGLSPNGQGLGISWSETRDARGSQRLVVDWHESFDRDEAADTPSAGFGSRLIDASLRGELSGTLTRAYHDKGLRIRLEFPLGTAPNMQMAAQ